MKININIPESINDISLDQYQRFFDIYDEKANKDFINRMALSIFYEIEGKYYNKMKVADIEKIVSELNKALEQKINLVSRFELHGVEYGLIPDFDDMTMGEFVDLDANTDLDKMHRLMSILYRPIKNEQGKRYDVEPYSGTNDKLKGMPLGVALSCMDFFFAIALQLTSDILNSLTAEEQAQTEKLTLVKNGVGTLQSTPWRVGMLPSMTM